jgi:hypothetical protein
MNKKINLFLITLTGVATVLGLLIFISPLESQKLINSWFENNLSNSMISPNSTSPDLKVTGPASSRSNFSQ